MAATLDEMEARAQRHLDGMTVNRDAMARDVLTLVRSIRAAQKRAAELASTSAAGASGRATYRGPFADIFDDIFSKAFKGD